MYSNFVECRPLEGLLCKYYYACAWIPFLLAFHLSAFFLCRLPLVAAFPAGQLLRSLWQGKEFGRLERQVLKLS